MHMERIVKELINTFGQHQRPPVEPVADKGN
jgi:hypothetical protein